VQSIVVVEDDADLLRLLQYNLEKEGYAIHGLQTGERAFDLCAKLKPSAVILDIMLPHTDGLEVLRSIRRSQELALTPVILLTARVSETDRLIGLELGANDYIVKPFFMRELIARVKLQVRKGIPSRLLEAGEVTLDRDTCEVRISNKPVSLSATEFRLLEFLMSRPGLVFSREELLDKVWGYDRAVTSRAVDVYIMRLRQKLQDPSDSPHIIHSVRGFGYTLRSSKTKEPPAPWAQRQVSEGSTINFTGEPQSAAAPAGQSSSE
jgi:DNA-binding response OmpR family regulator